MSKQTWIISILFDLEGEIEIHSAEAANWKEALSYVLEKYVANADEEDINYAEMLARVKDMDDVLSTARAEENVYGGVWFNAVTLDELL